jgi:hypothetical protein
VMFSLQEGAPWLANLVYNYGGVWYFKLYLDGVINQLLTRRALPVALNFILNYPRFGRQLFWRHVSTTRLKFRSYVVEKINLRMPKDINNQKQWMILIYHDASWSLKPKRKLSQSLQPVPTFSLFAKVSAGTPCLLECRTWTTLAMETGKKTLRSPGFGNWMYP